jgi:predicted regulator of Ras-like GTPase activity (Roadblock/LC7/MglB family)
VSKKRTSASQARATSFEQILQEMSQSGRFSAVVLASGDGLPIATAPVDLDAERTAAMVALLQRTSRQAREELDMAELDELSVSDRDRTRLVCRFFSVDGEDLILAVMLQASARYRRATRWAMRRITALEKH